MAIIVKRYDNVMGDIFSGTNGHEIDMRENFRRAIESKKPFKVLWHPKILVPQEVINAKFVTIDMANNYSDHMKLI